MSAETDLWFDYLTSRGFTCVPLSGKVPTVSLRGRTESVRPTGSQNLGVMTRGLVVVDIDDPAAATPEDFPQTFTVRTSRGWHLYYKADPLRPVTSCKLGGDSRIDVKAHPNHYVVGPGSLHSSGNMYLYEGGTIELVSAAVLDRCSPLVEYPEHAPIGNPKVRETPALMRSEAERLVLRPMREAREGNRNGMLHWCANRFWEHAYFNQFGMDTLYELAHIAEAKGLSVREIKATIDSARRTADIPATTVSRG